MAETSRRPRPTARRELLLTEVLAGRGTVSELSERFDISPATVRRDLQLLAAQGRATRTYGGAVGRTHPAELTLEAKEHAWRGRKDAIAAYAASVVGERDVLVLDAGTTTGRLAHHLRGRDGLTVLTTGVNTLLTLHDCDGIELVVLGGRLRHTSQALLGPLTEAALRHVVADKVFLGVDGIAADRGISCPTLEQASLKSLMAAQAREVYVLADHSKLSQAPFPYFAPLTSPVTLITDADAAPARIAELERDPHLRVQLAPPSQPDSDN
ncbi:MAG: DeoR/GlpR family DNA-binding transcription regulator [Sciscionella sp.]